MFWRRKPRAVDFSEVTEAQTGVPVVDFDGIPVGGPARPVSFRRDGDGRPMDREEAWLRLGERAWELLEKKRASELFPGDSLSEFERYLKLAALPGSNRQKEVFIGVRHPRDDDKELGPAPMFVPREVFQRHAYVLGASGFGKTSHALAQLLIQLAKPYSWVENDRDDPTGIMIIDLKPSGDAFLRALAERVAHDEGRKFRFFSTDPTYRSVQFDPFTMLRATEYPLERAEMLIKAFSLVYAEGYGSDFFTAEQRTLLTKIMHEARPRSYQELVDRVHEATTGDSGNKDARGLYSAISNVQMALHLNVDSRSLPPEEQVDFDRYLADGEILYVHLDSRGTYLLGRDVGKLMLFALLKIATEREKRREKRQAFVLIDEFQRLAARNVVEMLEDARSAGIGFVLAHQSSSSLQTRDGDLYGVLFENCSFKQCLTLEDPRVVDLFKLISGEVLERRYSGATTKGQAKEKTRTWSKTSSDGDSFGHTDTWSPSGEGYSDAITTSHSDGESTGGSRGKTTSESKTESWQDVPVPGLKPRMIVEVNNVELLSLVHVKGASKGVTPTGGVPILIQGLYPVKADEYKQLSKLRWPSDTVTEEEYYSRARPEVPASAVAAVGGAPASSRRGRRQSPDGGRRRAGASTETRNHLEQLLNPLFERLQAGMLGEFVSVETFARQHGLTVDRVLELAAALQLPVTDRNGLIRPYHAASIERFLRTFGGESAPPA